MNKDELLALEITKCYYSKKLSQDSLADYTNDFLDSYKTVLEAVSKNKPTWEFSDMKFI